MKAQKRTFTSQKGKNRNFLNAIQRVHVGVAHQLLSNASSVTYLSTRLVGTAHTDLPAFRVELDELATQHVTSIFRSFHREVSPLCETKALMTAYLPTIVDHLLTHMERAAEVNITNTSGSSNEDNNNNNDNNKINKHKGDAHNNNEFIILKPFLTMSVALFREYGGSGSSPTAEEQSASSNNNQQQQDDSATTTSSSSSSFSRILPLLDAFVAVAYRCLFDSSERIIADAERLQAVFLTQASWLRDSVLPELVREKQAFEKQQEENESSSSSSSSSASCFSSALLRRVIFMYCKEMVNPRNPIYVRRLTMEALSTIFRKLPQESLQVLAEFLLSGQYRHQLVVSMQQQNKNTTTSGSMMNSKNKNANNNNNRLNFITESIHYGLGCLFSELLSGLAGSLHTRHGEFIRMIATSFKLLSSSSSSTSSDGKDTATAAAEELLLASVSEADASSSSSSPIPVVSSSQVLQYVGFNGLVASAEKVIFDLTKAKTSTEFFSTVLQILESIFSLLPSSADTNSNNNNNTNIDTVMTLRLLVKFVGARYAKMLTAGVVTSDDFAHSYSSSSSVTGKRLPLLVFFEDKMFPLLIDHIEDRQNQSLKINTNNNNDDKNASSSSLLLLLQQQRQTLLVESLSLISHLVCEKSAQHIYVSSFCSHLLHPMIELFTSRQQQSSSSSTTLLSNILLPFVVDVISKAQTKTISPRHMMTFSGLNDSIRLILSQSCDLLLKNNASNTNTNKNNNNNNGAEQQESSSSSSSTSVFWLHERLYETLYCIISSKNNDSIDEASSYYFVSSILTSEQDWSEKKKKFSSEMNDDDDDDDEQYLSKKQNLSIVKKQQHHEQKRRSRRGENESNNINNTDQKSNKTAAGNNEQQSDEFLGSKLVQVLSKSASGSSSSASLVQSSLILLQNFFNTIFHQEQQHDDGQNDNDANNNNNNKITSLLPPRCQQSLSDVAVPLMSNLFNKLHESFNNANKNTNSTNDTSSNSSSSSSSLICLSLIWNIVRVYGEPFISTQQQKQKQQQQQSNSLLPSQKTMKTILHELLRSITSTSSENEERDSITSSVASILESFCSSSNASSSTLSMLQEQQGDSSNLIRLIISSLSSHKQQVRILSLKLLLRLFQQEQTSKVLGLIRSVFLSTNNENSESQQELTSIRDYAVKSLNCLLRAETADPFAEGQIDVKKVAVSHLSFDAAAGRLPEVLRIIFAKSAVGLFYIRFADLWPEALRILRGSIIGEYETEVWREVSKSLEVLLFPYHQNQNINDDNNQDDDADEKAEDDEDNKEKKDGDQDDENEDDDQQQLDDVEDDEDLIDQMLSEEQQQQQGTKSNILVIITYPTPYLLVSSPLLTNNSYRHSSGNNNTVSFISFLSALTASSSFDDNNSSESSVKDHIQLFKGSTDLNTLMTTACKFISTTTSSTEKSNNQSKANTDNTKQYHTNKKDNNNNNNNNDDDDNDEDNDAIVSSSSVIRASVEQWTIKSILTTLSAQQNQQSTETTSSSFKLSSISVTLSKLEVRRLHCLLLACASFAQSRVLSSSTADFLRKHAPSFLLCTDIDAQRAALIILRRLRVKPFDSAFDYLAPLVTLSHQKAKQVLPHLQTFDAATLNVDIRASVVANMVLLMLPKMNIGSIATNTNKSAGSSGGDNAAAVAAATSASSNNMSSTNRRDKSSNRDSTGVTRVLRIFGSLTNEDEADQVVSMVIERILLGHQHSDTSVDQLNNQAKQQQQKTKISSFKSGFSSTRNADGAAGNNNEMSSDRTFAKIKDITNSVVPWLDKNNIYTSSSSSAQAPIFIKKSQARRLAMALSVLHEFMSVQLSHNFDKWGGFAFELSLRCWRLAKAQTVGAAANSNNNSPSNKFLRALVTQCESAIANSFFNYPQRSVQVLLSEANTKNNSDVQNQHQQVEVLNMILAVARDQIHSKINGMANALLSSPLLTGSSSLLNEDQQNRQQSSNNNFGTAAKSKAQPLGLTLLTAIFRPNLAPVFAPLIEALLMNNNSNNNNVSSSSTSTPLSSLVAMTLSAPLKMMERMKQIKERVITATHSAANSSTGKSNINLLLDSNNNNNANQDTNNNNSSPATLTSIANSVSLMIDATLSTNLPLLQRATSIVVDMSTVGLDCLSSLLEFRKHPQLMECFFILRREHNLDLTGDRDHDQQVMEDEAEDLVGTIIVDQDVQEKLCDHLYSETSGAGDLFAAMLNLAIKSGETSSSSSSAGGGGGRPSLSSIKLPIDLWPRLVHCVSSFTELFTATGAAVSSSKKRDPLVLLRKNKQISSLLPELFTAAIRICSLKSVVHSGDTAMLEGAVQTLYDLSFLMMEEDKENNNNTTDTNDDAENNIQTSSATQQQKIDFHRHYVPLCTLLNLIPHPVLRLKICDILPRIAQKLFSNKFSSSSASSSAIITQQQKERLINLSSSMGNFISSMNSFTDVSCTSYDYDMRYFTFHSISQNLSRVFDAHQEVLKQEKIQQKLDRKNQQQQTSSQNNNKSSQLSTDIPTNDDAAVGNNRSTITTTTTTTNTTGNKRDVVSSFESTHERAERNYGCDADFLSDMFLNKNEQNSSSLAVKLSSVLKGNFSSSTSSSSSSQTPATTTNTDEWTLFALPVLTNILFFLRDKQQSIRIAAAESMTAFLKLGKFVDTEMSLNSEEQNKNKKESHQQKVDSDAAAASAAKSKEDEDEDEDDENDKQVAEALLEEENDENDDQQQEPSDANNKTDNNNNRQQQQQQRITAFDYLLRNFIMPSMRHSIVASDPQIRSAAVELWGVLPRYMPLCYASLVPLLGGQGIHSSAEQSFFSTVTSTQHKLRLRGLNILRKQCKQVAVRDLLRTLIPFLMCCLKDIVQGKEKAAANSNYKGNNNNNQDAAGRNDDNSAGSKYSADAISQTLAAVASVLPWEGYSSVLKKMIKTAAEEEALRPAMLKAVARVLDAFTFLPNLNTVDAEKELQQLYESKQAQQRQEKSNNNAASSTFQEDQQEVPFVQMLKKELASFKKQSKKSVANAVSQESRLQSLLFSSGFYNFRQRKVLKEIQAAVLPDLLKFVVSPVKKGSGKNLSHLSNDPRLTLLGKNAVSTSLNRSSPATQMQVAVAIVKLLRFLPGGFDAHAEPLLNEIILRLRTKKDETRENARGILCATMKEVGVAKLPFVLRTFQDCFIHGYQKHVLSYTMAVVLSTLRPEFIVSASASESANKKAERNVAILDNMLTDLLSLFIDDYIGELAEQKEQAELASSLPEIKHSKGLSGCVFLAEHASCELVLKTVAQQIRYILDPSNARQMNINNMLTTNPVVDDKKSASTRVKQTRADYKYVKKVRELSIHLAIALAKNPNIPSERLLAFSEKNLKDNNAVREEKLKRFESKAGYRRIRGNMTNIHEPAKKPTRADQLKSTFEIQSRPERIDVDTVTNTVLGTGSSEQSKKKQGLKNMQRGRIMKKAGDDNLDASSLSVEDPSTAQLLDVMDELALRVTLLVTRRLFRKEKTPETTAAAPAAASKTTKEEDETKKKKENNEEDDDDFEFDEEEKEEKDQQEEKEEAKPFSSEDVDEAIDRIVDGDNNNKNQQQQKNKKPNQQQSQSIATAPSPTFNVTSSERAALDLVVDPTIKSLQGEGADTVVTCSLDVLHTMLALHPMLPTLTRLSGDLIHVLLGLSRRGGIIRDRCLRSVAAIVANKNFKLQNEVAQRLVASIRTEVLDRTNSLNSALSVLTTVIAKKPQIPELYEIITPITDLMMNYALGRKALRQRCIVVITRFLTEMPMTKEKFRSHVDLYLKSMRSYPDPGGRIALCELLEALIFRLPSPVLAEESMILFIPLVETACKNEPGYESLQQKAAAVLVSLMTNAGLHVFAPAIQEWCKKKDNKKIRETGIQLLPLFASAAVAASQYWYADSLLLLKLVEDRSSLRQNSNIVGNQITTKFDADDLDGSRAASAAFSSSSKTQQQNQTDDQQDQQEQEQDECIGVAWSVLEWAAKIVHETLAEFASDDQFGAGKHRTQITQKHKAAAESTTWAMVYQCLRVVEIVTVQFAPELAHHFFADVRDTVLPVYLHHSQPWVRSAALRIASSYLRLSKNNSPSENTSSNNYSFISPAKALSLCNRLIDNIAKLNVEEVTAKQHVSRIVQVLDYQSEATYLRELIISMFALCVENSEEDASVRAKRGCTIVQHLKESVSGVVSSSSPIAHSVQCIIVLQLFNRLRNVAESNLVIRKNEDNETNNDDEKDSSQQTPSHIQQLSSGFEKFSRFFSICASTDAGQHFSRLPEVAKGLASNIAHHSKMSSLAQVFATLHVRAYENRATATLRDAAVKDVRAAAVRRRTEDEYNGNNNRGGYYGSNNNNSHQQYDRQQPNQQQQQGRGGRGGFSGSSGTRGGSSSRGSGRGGRGRGTGGFNQQRRSRS